MLNKENKRLQRTILEELKTQDAVGNKCRWRIIRELAYEYKRNEEVNWQIQVVPEDTVKNMLNLFPNTVSAQQILVLFSLEFIVELVSFYKIDPKKIGFIADTKAEHTMANFLGVRSHYMPKYKVTIDGTNDGDVDLNKVLENIKKAKETFGMSKQDDTFDIVIGNPPYHEEDGGHAASSKSLYHRFIIAIITTIGPEHFSFIIPSRWMAGGKGLDGFREWFIKGAGTDGIVITSLDKNGKINPDRKDLKRHIRTIVDYKESVFPTGVNGTNISGGVCYFHWQKSYDGDCTFNGTKRDIGQYDIVVRDEKSLPILQKVLTKHSGPYLDKRVLVRKPYGLSTNFIDYSETPKPGFLGLWTSEGLKYVDKDKVPKNCAAYGTIKDWKVLISAADGAAMVSGTILSLIDIAKPNEICLETKLVAGTFNNEQEAKNYQGYLQTKFARFMLSLRKISQHNSVDRFSWVPDLDYKKLWTDIDLYKIFGLTQQEIEHVEKTIK
jgi:Eco57I restriction endonuclease.